MKKLLIILFLLISINGISQTQKYWSYQRLYTEKDYTETFDDTSKVVIEEHSNMKVLIITNKTTVEFIPIYEIKSQNTNALSLKSIVYKVKERYNLPLAVEFLYSSGMLIEIRLTRTNNISSYIIHPFEDWL